MNDKTLSRDQKRLKEIEDRKIEILLEIGHMNRDYDEKLSGLYSEYERLDKEYYKLKLLPSKNGRNQHEGYRVHKIRLTGRS